MSLDLYTRNIPLTQKARFWGNYVSALKGQIIVNTFISRINKITQAMLTFVPPQSPASSTSTPPSLRQSPPPTPT